MRFLDSAARVAKRVGRGASRLGLERLPLQRGEGLAPVFIVGSGRSGNTVLRRMLMAGGHIHFPPETYVLGRILADVRRLAPSTEHWSAVVALSLGHLATSEDVEGFPATNLRPVKLELEALAPERRSLAAVLDAFYRYMPRAAGSEVRRWGDKTPLNTFALPGLLEVFPDARVVWMYRDGYDVTASYLAMGRYSEPEEAADRWVRSNEACAAFARAHPDRVFRMRYETMVREPERVLRELCANLALPFDAGMVTRLPEPDALGDTALHAHHRQVHRPLSTASVGRGREKLGAAVVARLAPLIDPQTARLKWPDA